MTDDISKTLLSKSDQLNAVDLSAGPMVLRITEVVINLSNKQQPMAIFYDGCENRPYKPSLGFRRILAGCLGIDKKNWIGKSIKVFLEPSVIYAGQEVGGIQVSECSVLKAPKKFPLKLSRTKIITHTVYPLQNDTHAQILKDGEIQAAQGIDALQAWFNGLDGEQKKAIKPDLDRLKSIANNVTTEPEEEGIL